MGGLKRWQQVGLAAVVVVILGRVALINPIGRMILQQPTAGGPCETIETAEAFDFTSPFNSDNRLVNGAMIRSAVDDARPDCTRIGNSYRCTQSGPATVEIRTTRTLLYYGIPAGTEAIIFGGPREAFCVTDAPEDAW